MLYCKFKTSNSPFLESRISEAKPVDFFFFLSALLADLALINECTALLFFLDLPSFESESDDESESLSELVLESLSESESDSDPELDSDVLDSELDSELDSGFTGICFVTPDACLSTVGLYPKLFCWELLTPSEKDTLEEFPFPPTIW